MNFNFKNSTLFRSANLSMDVTEESDDVDETNYSLQRYHESPAQASPQVSIIQPTSYTQPFQYIPRLNSESSYSLTENLTSSPSNFTHTRNQLPPRSNLNLSGNQQRSGSRYDVNYDDEEDDVEDDLSDETEENDDIINDLRVGKKSEIVMCLLYQNGKMACCYYDPSKKCVYYLKEIQETSRFEITNLLMEDLGPKLTITSERSDHSFINYLKLRLKYQSEIEDHLDSDDLSSQFSNIPHDQSLKTMSTIDFDYESAKEKIFSLNTITGMPRNMNQTDKIIYFGSLIDLESKLAVRCAGALLKHLSVHRQNPLQHANNQFETFDLAEIFSIRPVCLDKLLLLDANSFKSLEIFSEVDYACAFKQTNSASSDNFRTTLNQKQNNTLYALYLSKLQTKIGIGKLRSFMLKPTRDLNVLGPRLRLVDFFVNSQNQTLVKFIEKSLRSCKYIAPILKRMKTCTCTLTEWKRLHKTTQSFLNIIYAGNVVNERLKGTLHDNYDSYLKSSPSFQQHSSSSSSFQRQSSSFFQHSRQSESETHHGYQKYSDDSDADDNETVFSKFLGSEYGDKFAYLINLFDVTVNLKESEIQKKLVVNSNVSKTLEERRRFYASFPIFLTQIAEEEMIKYDLNECRYVYLSLLGFIMKLKLEDMKLDEVTIQEDDNLEEEEGSENYTTDVEMTIRSNDAAQCVTSSGKTPNTATNSQEKSLEAARKAFEQKNNFELIYKTNDGQFCYKTEKSRYLDENIGDIAIEIDEIESQIVDNFQARFVKYSHLYADMCDICAELDCLLSFALVAIENNYCKPNLDINKQSFVLAKNVRHPLVELNFDSPALFVPNDVESGISDEDSKDTKIKIITGPNASGKTVYMKQVGLLVYMSMIGSYVAASEAHVGDFDRIFTRLSSNESISVQLSSFFIDLKQLTDSLNGSTYKSLIFIDEFGRGTQLAVAQALVAATVRYLIKLSVQNLSPHVYMTTHLYEILHQVADVLFTDVSKLEFLSFETQVERIDKTEQFLFKLKRNSITNSSHAINVAQLAGLPVKIIEKYNELYQLIRNKVYRLDSESRSENQSNCVEPTTDTNVSSSLNDANGLNTNGINSDATSSVLNSATTSRDSSKIVLKDCLKFPNNFIEIREITKDVLKFNYDMIPNEQSQTNEQNDRKEIKKQNWLKLIKLHKWN